MRAAHMGVIVGKVFLSALGVDEEHDIESLLLSYDNDSDNVCVMLYVIYMLSVHRMGAWRGYRYL